MGQRQVCLPFVGPHGFQRPLLVTAPLTGGEVYNPHTLAAERPCGSPLCPWDPHPFTMSTEGSYQVTIFKRLWEFCTGLAGVSGLGRGSNPFCWDSPNSPPSFECGNSLRAPFFDPFIHFAFCSLIQKICIESYLPPRSSYRRHRGLNSRHTECHIPVKVCGAVGDNPPPNSDSTEDMQGHGRSQPREPERRLREEMPRRAAQNRRDPNRRVGSQVARDTERVSRQQGECVRAGQQQPRRRAQVGFTPSQATLRETRRQQRRKADRPTHQ